MNSENQDANSQTYLITNRTVIIIKCQTVVHTRVLLAGYCLPNAPYRMLWSSPTMNDRRGYHVK